MQEPGRDMERKWGRNREMEGTKARVYKRPRHCKIIISARISSWDCEGEVHSEECMKDASRHWQTRFRHIWKSTETSLFGAPNRRIARVTGCVQVRLVARTSDNRASWIQQFNITYYYGTEAWHIKNTSPFGRWDSIHLARETLTEATCQCAEIDCWSRSLSALSNLAVNSSTQETVTRVNRLINTWSADDALSTEGFEGIKANYKKLVSGLNEIKTQSDRDVKYTRVDMTS